STGSVLSSIGGKERPGLIHRLDKETSGVMVVAKSDQAHQALSAQFKRHSIMLALSLLVLAVIVLFAKELYFIAFDQEMAEASGVRARPIFYLLLTLVAFTVVISLKTVGAILVFAMLLIPASTAYQLTHSLSHMTIYS
ncbi:metal ABC transporter permease, partial [Nitrospiraceae bacterium AH_259_D15_M11_P09]|nr:metal ABC transporter permease [Nitrospiraceae bacterium AH_259_D15_M11_P09]